MTAFFKKMISFLLSFFLLLAGLLQGGGSGGKRQTSFQNLVYGSDRTRQSLDLELPAQTGETGLILFIHGGAWIAGGKEVYRDSLKTYTDLGYAAASINYRYLSETVSMEDELRDIAAALTKIAQTAKQNGNSISNALLTGHSAGGHLSLLYAYRCQNDAPIKAAAVVSFCGPTDLCGSDFLEHNAIGNTGNMLLLMSWAAGCPITLSDYENKTGSYDLFMQRLRAISPINCVGANSAPSVLAYGQQDPIVPFADAEALHEALAQNGVAHQLIPYPHSGHDLAGDPDCAALTYRLFAQYAAQYL